MLFFGALTSTIFVLEVIVAGSIDVLGWRRAWAAAVCGLLALLLGIPSALDLNFLSLMNKLSGDFLLVLGGLLTSLLVGYKLLDSAQRELSCGLSSERLRQVWGVLLKYVAPPILLIVLVFAAGSVIAAARTLLGG